MPYNYTCEISELLDNGMSYEEACAWCEFVCGKDDNIFTIENITESELEVLEDNEINYCPEEDFFKTHNIWIEGEEEYNRAIELIGRK